MDIISKWHTAQVIYHYLEGTIPEKDSAIRRPTAEFSNKGLQTLTQYNIDTVQRRIRGYTKGKEGGKEQKGKKRKGLGWWRRQIARTIDRKTVI